MTSANTKETFSKRYFLRTIIGVFILEFILRFFATPTWVFMVLLGLIILWISWLGWTLLADRQSESTYAFGIIVLLLSAQNIFNLLHFPDWWDTILLIAIVPLLPWSIWYALRERRNTADKQTNTTE